MNTTIAQLISLISYGNDYLINGNNTTEYYPNNTTFQYCNKVSFVISTQSIWSLSKKEIEVGKNPLEWFNYLKGKKCKGLKLYHRHTKDQSRIKDYMLAGFVGGGGDWFIETLYEKHSDFWYAHWEVTNQDASDNKIWTVTYKPEVKGIPSIALNFDQAKAEKNLRETLNKIQAFAYQHNADFWGDWFSKALRVIDDDQPSSDFHPDMIVLQNYKLHSQQLIFGACASCVFGGMGSWNDLGFQPKEEQEKYSKFTDELYEAVLEALIAGINS
ncbi:MAG: hypothetical protein ACTHMD_13915 [Flavisolibacter sp.]